jgi:hypothetical protein
MHDLEQIRDIVILCHSSVLNELTKTLETITNALEEQVDVLSNGFTTRYGIGIIVLECHGPIPLALEHELKSNALLTDYVSYFVPTYDSLEEASRKE